LWDYYKNIYPHAKTLNDSGLQKYFVLWDFRIEQNIEMVKSKKITIKDAFNELKWYTVLFSEIETISEEFLLRMQKITNLTNGIGDFFIDIISRLSDCLTINYRVVLDILLVFIKNGDNPDWILYTKFDIVRQILGEIFELLDSDEDQAMYGRILDELHTKGYDISGFST